MIDFENKWANISYEDTDEIKQQVFDAVVEFCKKYDAFCGETICQCDTPSLEAPNLLANIVDDIIKFNVVWKD